MKLLLVVNPISGGVNKEPFLARAKQLLKKYGVDYHIFKTTGINDEIELKKSIDAFKPDRIASVGGDGTTLFTSVALLNSDVPMGIIPLGSANGMATELSVNNNPIEALKDVLLTQVVKTLDVLKVNNEHYSIHIGDVGLNAQIVHSYEKDTKRGMATYAKYFIEKLTKLDPFPVVIEAANQIIKSNVHMVGICNARKYGTGIPLNKNGNPMDGRFEIVLIEHIDGKSLLRAGLSKFDDNMIDVQRTKVVSTEKALISFDQPRMLQLDGEVIGEFEEINIEIVPGGVNMLTHRGNSYV